MREADLPRRRQRAARPGPGGDTILSADVASTGAGCRPQLQGRLSSIRLAGGGPLTVTKLDLQTPLFATYSFVNRRGWLRKPWAKRLFRESYFFYKKYYEDPFWRLVKNRPSLFRGGHVLDVGANIGYTSYCFANGVEPDCFVYAFEPEAINFTELLQTAKRPAVAGRIKPVRKAVGDERKEVDLWINDDHHGDHRIITSTYRSSGVDVSKTERVEVISIDEFAKEQDILGRIRFVKMDVQGYELPVCAGMVETLDANPDITVVAEYSPEHLKALGFEPTSLLSFFRERQFQGYLLSRPGRREVLRPWDWQTTGAAGYVDVLFSRKSLL